MFFLFGLEKRDSDRRDIIKFQDQLNQNGKFRLQLKNLFSLQNSIEGNIEDVQMKFFDLLPDLSQEPLAVFVITTPEVADELWFPTIKPQFEEDRYMQGKQDSFMYTIVYGSGGHSQEQALAKNLGGVYLRYNSDVPTNYSIRLVEFMNRVMGFNLPGEKFPNCSLEEVRQIAAKIRKESFNMHV